MGEKVQPSGLPVVDRGVGLQQVDRPIISSMVRKPSSAMIMRSFLGDHEEVVDHVLGLALELLAQLGSWVATPTGQVFRWHLRIMMQPRQSAARCEADSSAPSSAAMATSRPVFS